MKTIKTIKQWIHDRLIFLKDKWVLWLFPTIAFVVMVALFYSHYHNLGPSIFIEFEDGAGIEAGKTPVKYRGIVIGQVVDVALTVNAKGVLAEVQLDRSAARFAVEGTMFWIVTPQVGLQGVTGLDTLMQGVYITVMPPGDPSNVTKIIFKASPAPDNVEDIENTSTYILETGYAESIQAGDGIYFRGVKVGTVSRVILSKNRQQVLIYAHIENRYASTVRKNTVFWRKSAVHANFGLFSGAQVDISSMESLMKGGIEYFSPTKLEPKAKWGEHFKLNAKAPEDFDKWNPSVED